LSIVPQHLNDFKIYKDGSTDYKGVADLQLPSFDPMTETVSGGGLAGEVEEIILGHFQSMKLTINWKVITDEITDFLKPITHSLDCRLVNQEYDATARQNKLKVNRVSVRGKATKNDFGKASKGSAYDGSSEIEIEYIKVQRDGFTIVELDKYNYIYVVDGVDYMAELREALGMEG
jgi:uncharacterized protein